MLWLNTSDGTTVDSPKRPSSNDWVVVVKVKGVEGREYYSTIQGITDFLADSGVGLENLDIDSTQIDSYDTRYQNDKAIERLNEVKFPYFSWKIDSDDVLEIKMKKTNVDNTQYEPVKSAKANQDDETFLPQGGSGGGGGSPLW